MKNNRAGTFSFSTCSVFVWCCRQKPGTWCLEKTLLSQPTADACIGCVTYMKGHCLYLFKQQLIQRACFVLHVQKCCAVTLFPSQNFSSSAALSYCNCFDLLEFLQLVHKSVTSVLSCGTHGLRRYALFLLSFGVRELESLPSQRGFGGACQTQQWELLDKLLSDKSAFKLTWFFNVSWSKGIFEEAFLPVGRLCCEDWRLSCFFFFFLNKYFIWKGKSRRQLVMCPCWS